MSEVKTIRFIDSHYNLLFTVPDGGNVSLTFSDGETVIRQCQFIDDYHTKIGSSIYHICEFAENMERNGTTYVPELPVQLPELCYGVHPTTGELITIKRGEDGYSACGFSTDDAEQNRWTAERMNRRAGITKQQLVAMEAGSHFGWNVPAANPNHYDVHGKMLPQMVVEKAVAPSQRILDTKKKRSCSDLER